MFEIIFPTGYHENKINGNIDVIIKMKHGDMYSGTIFSIENIIYLKSLPENKNYFWASDMVIVDDLDLSTINSCIENMISENVISLAFEKISNQSDNYVK